MKIHHIFFGIFNFFFLSHVSSQDINYARYIIDTLASPGMYGRGYVNGGDKIAAAFIYNEFENLGLKYFDSNYYQNFSISANTLPGKIKVKINDKELIPVKDYLISSFSSSAFGIYETVRFSRKNAASEKALKKFLGSDYSDKIIVADKKGVKDEEILNIFNALHYYNLFNAKGVININDGKFAFDASGQNPKSGFFIDMRRNLLKKNQEVFVQIENKFYNDYTTQNIIGLIEGIHNPDSFIVFMAHYDHLGCMGSGIYLPGANDNASGVAMVLNLAKYYSNPESRPENSLVFMILGAEELGMLGSKFASEHPLFPPGNILFLVNLDLVGTGDDGIMIVNGEVYKEVFEKLSNINEEKKYLPRIEKRGEAAISDHYPFYEKKVPSFFIYTMGGISEYHNIYDKAETLPLTEFEDIVRLLIDFVGQF